MPKLCYAAAVTFVASLSLVVGHGQGQDQPDQSSPSSAVPILWTGVYTNEQAARGKENYEIFCFRCHKRDLSGGGDDQTGTVPALVGARFMNLWSDLSVAKIFRKVQVEMPPPFADVVSDDIKIDILAYILKSNGFPAGTRELTTDSRVLEAIRFVPRNSAGQREPRDLRLVRSTGCLAREASGWSLTRASDAILDEQPAGASPADTAAPLGARRYVLVGANGFKSENYRGHKVAVRGLIATGSTEQLIHLTSLESLTPTCAP